MDEFDKRDDGNIIKEADIIKQPYTKKPGRITAGQKLSEFNRLKKLNMKKCENKYNYYYLGIPVVVLLIYFMARKCDDKKYETKKYDETKCDTKCETKKSDHQFLSCPIIEI